MDIAASYCNKQRQQTHQTRIIIVSFNKFGC